MMSANHLFQDFGTLNPADTGKKSLSVDELEDMKLHSFESGFQAGWDEAIKAQADNEDHVSEEFTRSLQSASFEYYEVRKILEVDVQTIMEEVVNTILPLAARASLGAHVCDLIKAVTEKTLDRSIEIVVAPGREKAVNDVLTVDLPEPFTIVVDSTMSPNQACLRLGTKEIDIDLDKAVAEVASALSNFFEIQNSEVTDG